jgi:hypothetical protein
MMTLEYTFPDNGAVELCGPRVKFWRGTGLPDFVGDLEAFAKLYPFYMKILLANGVVRERR